MPFIDVVGRSGAAEFKHSGPIALNIGVICGSIVMFIVVCVAH